MLANGAVDGQPRWLLLLLDLGPVAKPPLFQGYLFARPAFEALPEVAWPAP